MKIDPNNFGPCVDKIAARGQITQGEAKQILQDVAARAETMRKTGDPDAFVKAAGELGAQLTEKAKSDRLDALNNAAKRQAIMDHIISEAGLPKEGETFGTKEIAENPKGLTKAANSIRSLMYWMPSAAKWDNAEGKGNSITRRLQAVMGNELRQGGLEKIAISGEKDYEIAEHLRRMSGEAPDESVKVSPEAQKIAEAIRRAQEYVRQRMNAEGAHIADANDYIDKTHWSPEDLRDAAGVGATPEEGFEAWWAKDGPRMADKTFADVTPKENQTLDEARKEMGESIYYAGRTGIHKTFGGLDTDTSFGFEGARNIAKKLSEGRVVFWKSFKGLG